MVTCKPQGADLDNTQLKLRHAHRVKLAQALVVLSQVVADGCGLVPCSLYCLQYLSPHTCEQGLLQVQRLRFELILL